jgi:photosystem II stability/assembly factor-like uncharacterized protein
VLLAGIFSTSTTNGSGIYRSTDGGNTWNLVLGGDQGTAVIFDPTNGNTAYAALGNPSGDPQLLKNGIYRSTDGGQTWIQVLSENSNVIGRIALAMAPSGSTTLYAAIAQPITNGGSSLGAMIKTIDGFKTFTTLTNTPDFCTPQCWYNNVIAVAPNNANIVFAGGISRPLADSSIDDHTVIRSLDGGNSWTTISVGSNGTVHTDTHAFAFSGDSSTLYVGSDGGVWSTTNIATTLSTGLA